MDGFALGAERAENPSRPPPTGEPSDDDERGFHAVVSMEYRAPEDEVNTDGVAMRAAIGPPVREKMPKSDKELTPRERKTLLAIIGVLADMAKIDIREPYKAGAIIEAAAEQCGCALKARTIGDKLKEVTEVLKPLGE